MKYEKFQVGGVDWIRITVDKDNMVERPMVDGDKALFEKGDVYEPEVPSNEPVPQEPYPEGP